MCASRETRSLTRHSLRAWSLCTRDVLLRQAKLEAYVEAKRNGTRHVDVLLRRREQCLRELRGSSSFSKDTERDEERVAKTIEYGSMIQLANGSSNFEELMEFYPADCDFAIWAGQLGQCGAGNHCTQAQAWAVVTLGGTTQ